MSQLLRENKDGNKEGHKEGHNERRFGTLNIPSMAAWALDRKARCSQHQPKNIAIIMFEIVFFQMPDIIVGGFTTNGDAPR